MGSQPSSQSKPDRASATSGVNADRTQHSPPYADQHQPHGTSLSSALPPAQIDRRELLGKAMGSHVVGPVPLRDLVEQCFNQGARFDTLAKTLQTKKLDKDFRENMLVAVAKGEDKMIEKMCKIYAMDDTGYFPSDKMTFSDTQTSADVVNNLMLKPDAQCYMKARASEKTSFELAELTIEAKSFKSGDPFEEIWIDYPPPTTFPNTTSSGDSFLSTRTNPNFTGLSSSNNKRSSSDPPTQFKRVTWRTDHALIMGQLADYIAAMAHAALRCHCFLIFIAQGVARVTRWDHSAVLVSDCFDLRKEPWKLAAFLHIFADASPSDRGQDTTAQEVDENEAKKISTLFRERQEFADEASPMHEHYKAFGNSTRMVSFHVHINGVLERLIAVQKPSFCSLVFRSRFTRVWVVYCPRGREKKGVNLKLYCYKRLWRVDLPEVEPEHVIYDRLKRAHVEHIPTFLAHGDVGDDSDVACRWQKSIVTHLPTWNLACVDKEELKSYRPLRQYEFLMEEVGTPLHHLQSTRDIVIVVHDVAQTLSAALEKAGMLHRDISPCNIMFVQQGDGTLKTLVLDWHLSRWVRRIEALDKAGVKPPIGPRQPYRTGTWYFMSAKIINVKDNTHTLSDDLESLFYVLVWTVLRFFPTNVPEERLCNTLRDIFETRIGFGMNAQGAGAKQTYLRNGTIYGTKRLEARRNNDSTRNVPLTTLVNALQRLFVPRYTMVDVEDTMDQVPEEPDIDQDAFLALLKAAIDNPDWPTTDEEQWFDRAREWEGFDYGPMASISAFASKDPNMMETGKRRRQSTGDSTERTKKRVKVIGLPQSTKATKPAPGTKPTKAPARKGRK